MLSPSSIGTNLQAVEFLEMTKQRNLGGSRLPGSYRVDGIVLAEPL